jgi:hypothetical protein
MRARQQPSTHPVVTLIWVGAKLNHGVCKAVRALDEQHRQPAEPHDVYHRRRAFDTSRVGAWSALFGSAVYLCVFTIDGWLRPDYDAASMFISELSLGPWGWVQIVNFMIFGLALLVFAMSVALEFGDTRSARVGVTLLVIMGISMLASGPFVIDPVAGAGPVIDPVAVAPHQMSFHSKFHYALGTLFFLLAPATCFCFAGYKRSSKDPTLRVFRLWSFGLGIVTVMGMVLFKLALLPPASNPLLPWRGLIQRATVIPFLVWLFIFGLIMLKHAQVGRVSGIAGGATSSAA